MVGEYVMRQQDLQDRPHQARLDRHGLVQLRLAPRAAHPTPDGHVINEGDMQVPVKPYEIAYRCIMPKAATVRKPARAGLLLSASHVAYSSIRMEPQYMIMGHAAGRAAALSIRSRVPIQGIDIGELQAALVHDGQVLHEGQGIHSPPATGPTHR